MRIVFASFLSVILHGYALAQAVSPVEPFLTPSIRFLVDSYSRCAAQHLGNLARIDPSKSFDAVEASLKPVCGHFYNQVRNELASNGFTRGQVNWIIDQSYLRNEPEFRAIYQREIIAEYQRREAARLAEFQRQRDEQTKAERRKQLEAATQDHLACLKQQMKDIVLYSTEASDVLATVLMTKCADGERRRADLYASVYDLTISKVRQIVSDETRKSLLADIVTLRATLNKTIIENGKPGTATTPGDPGASL